MFVIRQGSSNASIRVWVGACEDRQPAVLMDFPKLTGGRLFYCCPYPRVFLLQAVRH